jgi:hypothetical protein
MPNRLRPPACWSTAKQRIRHSPGFGIAAEIMARDTGNTSIVYILLEHLPDDHLAHGVALYAVASIHRPEYVAFDQAGGESPSIDRNLHPRRRRNCSRPNSV